MPLYWSCGLTALTALQRAGLPTCPPHDNDHPIPQAHPRGRAGSHPGLLMALDLVIRGGTVATAEKVFQADVGIKDGKVLEIAPSLNGDRVIDAKNKLVLPGGI